MDSTEIVNFFGLYVNSEWAKAFYGMLVIIIPIIYRGFIHWANNRKTTWYWNPITKKFFVKWLDKQIAKICGRGVNDCQAKYEKELPDDAKEEIQNRLKKNHEFLNIEVKKDGTIEKEKID